MEEEKIKDEAGKVENVHHTIQLTVLSQPNSAAQVFFLVQFYVDPALSTAKVLHLFSDLCFTTAPSGKASQG